MSSDRPLSHSSTAIVWKSLTLLFEGGQGDSQFGLEPQSRQRTKILRGKEDVEGRLHLGHHGVQLFCSLVRAGTISGHPSQLHHLCLPHQS